MADHVTHASHEPIISGYLFSKGYFGDWVSRYVELHNDIIVYRFVKGGMKWGSFTLSARTKCEDNSDRHFCMLVSDPISKEKIYLGATNTSIKEAWSEAIHNILTGLRFAERKMKYGDQHKLVVPDEQREQHKIYVRIIQAKNLLAKDAEGCSDPYVKVTMGSATARTTTRKKNLNPDWGMVFPFSWDESVRCVKIEVWDEDLKAGDHFLGMVLIPVYTLRDGDTQTAWYPLGKRSTRSTVGGDIEVELACSGMPDRDSKAWRLFYQVQQLPDMTMSLAAKTDGNGQIALDFEGIRVSRKDHAGRNRCQVGDTDSVSSEEDDGAVGLPSTEDGDDSPKKGTHSACNVLHGFPLYFPPIELEQLEDLSLRVHLKCVVNTTKFACPGLLMLTNYRLLFLPNSRVAPASSGELNNPGGSARTQSDVLSRSSAPVVVNGVLARREVDLSTQIPISSIIDVTFTTDTEDSGPYAGSTFETIKVTTTDCRVVVFQFVEDVDALGHKHLHHIHKTFGSMLRGVGENVADNLARTRAHVINDLHHMNSAIVKTFAGDTTPTTTRESTPGGPVRGSESDFQRPSVGNSSPVDDAKRRSPVNATNGAAGQQWNGLGPSKLEKCWLRLIRENHTVVEGLNSEEGTPGQRIHNRIKYRVSLHGSRAVFCFEFPNISLVVRRLSTGRARRALRSTRTWRFCTRCAPRAV
jgi:hypothetical protein